MNPEQIAQYIAEERKKKIPDSKIYDRLKAKMSTPATPTTPAAEQRGFWGEVLPSAFSVGGGIFGGIVGGPLGAIAGATAGGGVGETIQQTIEKKIGQRKDVSTPQILATGVIGGVSEATGLGLAKVAQPLVKAGVSTVRPAVVKTLKFLSGYGDEVITRALERTTGAVEGVKTGELAINDIIKSSATKINQLAKDTVATSKKKIEELSKLSSGGPGAPGIRQTLLDEGQDFISRTTSALRREHNIGVTNEGELLFSRPTKPSRIVSGGDQKAIQDGYRAIHGITKDTTIKNIDAIMEKLIALRSKTPVGTPTGPETKQILGQMITEVKDFSRSLGNLRTDSGTLLSPNYAKYADFIEENIPKRVMIEDAKELFGGTTNLSPKETSKVANQLLQLFNSGKTAVRGGVEEIQSKIGEDAVGAVAGTLVKTGANVSQRAPNLSTRSLLTTLAEWLPREGLQAYIKTGKITGDLLNHPKIKMAETLFGISAKALLQEIANLKANKTTSE